MGAKNKSVAFIILFSVINIKYKKMNKNLTIDYILLLMIFNHLSSRINEVMSRYQMYSGVKYVLLANIENSRQK